MDVEAPLTGSAVETPAGPEPEAPAPETQDPVAATPGGVSSEEPSATSRTQSYDFRQPAFLSSLEMRKLRFWHEDYARAVAGRLSMYLRIDAAVQLTKIEAVPYHRFIQGIPDSTYVTLFKVEPLRGVSVMELPSRLGMILVDRLLGGPAIPTETPRELSELEMALLDEVVQMMLAEWTGRWTQRTDLTPAILGHETGGQFVQVASPNAMMLAFSLQVQIGEVTEHIQFGIPGPTLEPLTKELGRPLEGGAKERTGQPAVILPKWNSALDEVELTLAAEWTGMEVSVREWASLRPGDVLQLRPDASANVQIRIGAVTKYAGRLGSVEDHLAVEITKVLKS